MAELEWLDPESEAQYPALVEQVARELAARMDVCVAVGRDPSAAEEQRAIAELIADSVLDRFVVRERRTPRSRWRED